MTDDVIIFEHFAIIKELETMKQLVELAREANSLRSSAGDLESAVTKVALVSDEQFPAKKEVIELVANTVEKVQHVAGLLSVVCPESWAENAIVFSGVAETKTIIQDVLNQLGDVLDTIVTDDDLNDTDTKAWMSSYVAEARQFLSSLQNDLSRKE